MSKVPPRTTASTSSARPMKATPETMRAGSLGKIIPGANTYAYSAVSSAKIVSQACKDPPQRERILRLERILNYAGSMALTLYDGKLLLLASGCLLVLLDLTGAAGAAGAEEHGFWRAFEQPDSTMATVTETGYRQAFLGGHAAAIGIMEVRCTQIAFERKLCTM